MRPALAIATRSAEETRILGAALGPQLLPGDVVSLSGDLGAGKTTFVQGVAAALDVRGRVTSPSFMLVHHYEGRYRIVHVDVYRLTTFQEVIDLGFEELLDPEAILLVEWGEAVAPLLPRRYLDIDLRRADELSDDMRVLTYRARGEDWARRLEAMRPTAEAMLAAAAASGFAPARFVTESELRAHGHRVVEQRPTEN